MQLALLKLSTANAFAKGLNASSTSKGAESSTANLTQDAPFPGGLQGSNSSLFFHDDTLGAAFDDPAAPPSPQPRSRWYGMYADYEDVMELLHSGVVADASARRLLAHVSPDQLVHVAHLGLGACCSVDLVAVHCADGSRLLAAAKSCYLPPSDPRLRASLREADLLRRCADCPFIMQLLAVVQQHDLAAATAAGGGGAALASPGAVSPLGTPPRDSSELAAAGFGRGLVGGSTPRSAHDIGAPFGTPAAAVVAMMSSPAYQAWAQWRGGGAGEDLERQIMQRLMAGLASNSGGAAGTACLDSSGGVACGDGTFGTQMGLGLRPGGMGGSWRASMAGSGRSSLSGWDATGLGAQDESRDVQFIGGGLGFDAAAACSYGGGWAYGGGGEGGGEGEGAAAAAGGVASHGRRLRRASMDIIDMYGGCKAMGAFSGATAAGGDAADAPLMCTLLLGWARCGDLRRLVQLLLGRSPAHQNHPQTGAMPAVSGLPPLMPEEAARFYTGCLVLALEQLHDKLHTVHRDLKLANLLLLDNGYAAVGDLGTAVDLSGLPGGRLNARVGSPGHMAPECRDRDEAGYDTAADMWSVGACIFSLMTGQLPAGLAGAPNRQWSPPVSRHWSPELTALLGRLMAWSPAQRPTVAQLMRDPWFRGFNWRALRERRLHPPGCVPWRELLWWPKENRQLL